MGFLVFQIVLCLILAFLLGLLIGRLLWHRSEPDCAPVEAKLDEARKEIRRLERDLASHTSVRTSHFAVPSASAGVTPEALAEPLPATDLDSTESDSVAEPKPTEGPGLGAVSAPDATPKTDDGPEDVSEEDPRRISDLGPIGGPAAAAFIDDTQPLAPSPLPVAPEDDSEGSPTYDDLKRISGIGPAVERQLAEIGVTTYRQIAHFTDEDIERVGEHIDFFADRIRREGWVVQAAALHRETYGTSP